MTDLIIFGAGGFAKEVYFLAKEIGKYNFKGFVNIDNSATVKIGDHEFHCLSEEEILQFTNTAAVIAIGDGFIVEKIVKRFGNNFRFPNLIHPSAIGDWENITIGQGNIITAKVIFTTNIQVGSFNIFNLACTIGHDTTIGDFNVFNPCVNISGNVIIMNSVFIGTNATILQNLKIEGKSIIGGSSLINKNVESETTVVGVPGKVIKLNSKHVERNFDGFEVLTLNSKEKWKHYLSKFDPNSIDIYFTPQYYQIHENSKFGQVECFVFRKGKEIIIYPYHINEVNKDYISDKSVTYYDIENSYGYGGILCNTSNKKFIDDFYQVFSKYCTERNIIAEFARYHPLLNQFEITKKTNIKLLKDRKTVSLDLTKSYYDIWEHDYSSTNRNMIRKAKTKNFKIEIHNSPSSVKIKEFIRIYYGTMEAQKASKFYFFPENYFMELFLELKNNIYLINILDSTNKVICSSIFLHHGNYFHYHLSARSRDCDNSVNNFILDQAILFAQELGAEKFHFGGGRTTLEDDLLLKFKKNFSKQEETFYIYKKVHNEEIYKEVLENWSKNHAELSKSNASMLLKYKIQ